MRKEDMEMEMYVGIGLLLPLPLSIREGMRARYIVTRIENSEGRSRTHVRGDNRLSRTCSEQLAELRKDLFFCLGPGYRVKCVGGGMLSFIEEAEFILVHDASPRYGRDPNRKATISKLRSWYFSGWEITMDYRLYEARLHRQPLR